MSGRTVWEYAVVNVPATQDLILTLTTAGADGWEICVLLAQDAQGSHWLAKRQPQLIEVAHELPPLDKRQLTLLKD